MKKLYTILLSIFLFSAINAQQYYPMLDSINDWRYSYNAIGLRINPTTQITLCGSYPSGENELIANTDTVINSTAYKVLFAPNWNCIGGFMREDTAARKVYFRQAPSDSEMLVYDFSMQIGDTMTINFSQANGYWNSGLFTLDSIRPFHAISGWRRMFYLNNHTQGGQTLSWLESVGNQGDLIYPLGMNSMGYFLYNSLPYFPHNYTQILTCFDHDYMVYYDSIAQYYASHSGACLGYTDTCTYGNICDAIHSIERVVNISVSPNPAVTNAHLVLRMSEEDEAQIVIWDIEGRNIIRTIDLGRLGAGEIKYDLDVAGLKTGLYTLEIRTPSGSVYEELIVSH